MKKINFLFSALVLATASLTAQVNQTPLHSGSSRGQIVTKRENSQTATGSMFLNEKFMPAKLSNSGETVLARYNAYSDHFEMKNQSQQTVTIPKDKATKITFTSTNDTYEYVTYKTEKNETVSGYLNIVHESAKVTFYKRERIHLQPETFPNNSYQTYKPANYKKVDNEFYIKLNTGETLFISDKKDLAKLVPSKSKEILTFVKQNKIDFDNEQDLIQLGQYLETIL